MGKRGFTLMELLAVIVILAIIALIATPMILGVIESAKKGAAENGVMGYISAVEQYYTTSQLTGSSNYETDVTKLNTVIEVKGTKPTAGNLKLSSNHVIESGTFCMNGYYVAYDGAKAKVDTSKKCDEIATKPVNNCTFEGELVQGAEYVNGQYIYRYMQEGASYEWQNMTTDGWGVKIDPFSETITTKLCTTINGKPIVSMAHMFSTSKATSLDLSSFDTSNVINMESMFENSKPTSLDFSNFDTSKVTNMKRMFSGSYMTSLDLSSFDTSKVTDMSSMFQYSDATNIDLSSFDTSKVTDMSNMFDGSLITSLDLSSFDTSKVTNMSFMFYGSQATTGYARTEADATKFNNSNGKPVTLNFVVKSA